MTAPHASPPLAAPDMDAAVEALRSEGLGVSRGRRRVLEALFTAERPIPVEAMGLVREFHVIGLSANCAGNEADEDSR